MRNLLLGLITSCFFFCSASIDPVGCPSYGIDEGKRHIPSVDIKTMKGETFNTSKFSNNGKPMVIDFWATWCKPCIEELNAINENYVDWQKETGVKVVAVSLDDARTMTRVAPFVSGRGWTYESYIDPNGDFQRAMDVNNPPQTFLVNGKGEIVWQHVGFAPGNEDELYEMIKKVAKGTRFLRGNKWN